MKSIIWNSIAIISLIYVLSFGGFMAWLNFSGRVNKERLNKVYDMFAVTVQEEKELVQLAASEEAARQAQAAEEQRLLEVDLTATTPTEAERRSELLVAAERKLKDMAMAKRAVEIELERLTEAKARYQAMEKDFKDRIAAYEEERTSEAFKKTVELYELQPPKNVKNQFVDMLTNGTADQRKKNLDQVARLLDAMEPRRAADVLKQFKADGAQDGPNEVALAVEVMERLRNMGSDLAGQLGTQG